MRWILSLLLLAMPAGLSAETRLTGDLPRRSGAPIEALPGLETEYGAVRTSEGVRLRSIVTRPAGTATRLPAIFFTQAVACESLELPADRPTTLGEIARRSGMVLIRIDRAGSGDSEGPECSELDFDTEVRHYREAFDALAQHPWVDASRIFVYGSSLGSTTAPIVAEGRKVAGVIVQGGGAFTHLERMINFDRLYLERSGKYPPAAIHDEMIKRIAFHQLYLIGGQTPAQIARARPDLAGVWASIRGTNEKPHYGRPFAWHWQAARTNFLDAWTKIDAPVLVAYAEFDQFEPLQSHKVIVDTVNRLRPGSAHFLVLDNVDHFLRRHPDEFAAYRGEGGEPAREAFIQPMLKWLSKQAARP